MKNEFRNWGDVRVFLAVIREGSTLAASRKLGLAQPTVARRIDALEHELGLTLFERDTRGFRPTAEAQMLVPLAEKIEAATAELTAKVQTLTAVHPIRITAYSGNFSVRVNRIFSDFSALHPDIQLEFLPSVRVFDLLGGEADIALRISRNDPDPELISRKISTARYALYGSRAYADKLGLPSSVDDFRGHRFVSFQRSGVSSALHDWLTRHVPPEQIVLCFTEVDLMHAAIRAGHGLGVMNEKLAGDDDMLIRCFDAIEALTSQHLMLVAPQAYRRPEVRKFTKFFAPRYAEIYR